MTNLTHTTKIEYTYCRNDGTLDTCKAHVKLEYKWGKYSIAYPQSIHSSHNWNTASILSAEDALIEYGKIVAKIEAEAEEQTKGALAEAKSRHLAQEILAERTSQAEELFKALNILTNKEV